MNPIKFKEQNHSFGKPADMTDEQCGTLPVHVGTDESGFPVIISCWELSDQDIQNIIDHRKVYLTITGKGMPPVSLRTDTPFVEVPQVRETGDKTKIGEHE